MKFGNNAINIVTVKKLFVASAFPRTETFQHPKVREKLNSIYNASFDKVNGI